MNAVTAASIAFAVSSLVAYSNPLSSAACENNQLLANSNLDLGPGGGWVENGAGFPIIRSAADLPIVPHSGDYAGWMGRLHSATRALYQDISIPVDARSLQVDGYRLIVTEEQAGVWDVWTAEIRNQDHHLLESLGSFDNQDHNPNWQFFSFNAVGDYAGQDIRIYFENTNDSANLTDFFVDTFEVVALICPETIFQNGFESTIDVDAQITNGPSAEPGQIDSVAGSSSAMQVFDFAIVDGGTSDGLPTSVSEIVTRATGDINANAHQWTLSGPDAADVVGSVSGSIGNQSITFSGLSVEVADGASGVYAINLQLTASAAETNDNDQISLSISSQDLTTSSGTEFLPGEVNNGAGLAYEVVATELVVSSQPPAVVLVHQGFDMSVSYVDTHGNLDLDVAGDMVEVTRSDGGSVVAGLSAQAVSGVASFSSDSQVVLGQPPGSLFLMVSDQAGGAVDLSGSPPVSTNQIQLNEP